MTCPTCTAANPDPDCELCEGYLLVPPDPMRAARGIGQWGALAFAVTAASIWWILK